MSKEKINLNDLKVCCQSCNLAELCLPRGLSEADTELINQTVKRGQTLHRGDVLYRMGDSDHSLFVVRSGSFKTCLSTDTGEEQVLGFHLAGEIIGFDAFETGKHDCSAVALETSLACEIPGDRIEELCSRVSGLHHHMHALIGREIHSNHAMLLLLGKKNAEQRLAALLLSLAERYAERGFSQTDFYLHMPRRDIANYLGLAVETVSRLLAQMQDEGLLRVEHRHVLIEDLERLRSMVDSGRGQAAGA